MARAKARVTHPRALRRRVAAPERAEERTPALERPQLREELQRDVRHAPVLGALSQEGACTLLIMESARGNLSAAEEIARHK